MKNGKKSARACECVCECYLKSLKNNNKKMFDLRNIFIIDS